ncbi:MAG: DUF3795 domain-containing protein [Candidatus Lindowbacteria bacterium]|nr:DUF3795 domain-containing protein [Candidatus Lindowbacteria bacterium]
MAAPCGLYCGVCGFYRAYKTDNQKLKEKLGSFYGIEPKDIVCEGCLSDVVFGFCRACAVRACALEKNIEGCFECAEFPCVHIENYPFDVAKKYIMSGTKRRREFGTEKWIAWETAHYTCKECGAVAFREAKRCPECRVELKLEKAD